MKQVLLFYLLFLIGLLCECKWAPQYEGGGQSTTFESPFSPSTMVASGIQLRVMLGSEDPCQLSHLAGSGKFYKTYQYEALILLTVKTEGWFGWWTG